MKRLLSKHFPLFVLATTTILAWACSFIASQYLDLTTQSAFGRYGEQTRNIIRFQIQSYTDLLLQTRAFLDAVERIDQDTFHEFFASIDLRKSFPGVQGVGFTEKVNPSQLGNFIANQQQMGRPGFKVWPEHPRSEYHAIVFLEPLDWRNKRAIGFDMFSEPIRREAMERARDTGLPAATSVVRLVQETEMDTQSGFLIYIPVYGDGPTPTTVNERRKRLRGFVYSPFRATDLFESVLASRLPNELVDIEIFDGEPSQPNMLYDKRPESSLWTERENEFQSRFQIPIAERSWTLVVAPLQRYQAKLTHYIPHLIFFFGTTVACLLSYLALLNQRNTQKEKEFRRQSEQARRNALEAAVRAQFLSEATKTLSSTLNLRDSIPALAKLAVPRLADFCVIDIMNEDGMFERVAVEHTVESKAKALLEFAQAHPYSISDSKGLGYATSKRRTLLIQPFSDEHVKTLSRSEASRKLMTEDLKPKALVAVPLMLHESIHGMLVLGFSESDKVFTQQDVTTAEELATRIALAVENGKHYEEARTANRAKDQFLATLSHELRTPLNAIVGWAELLEREKDDPKVFAEGIESLKRNSKAQEELINDLLDVSKIISGKLQLNITQVNLVEVVRDAAKSLQLAAQAKQIDLAIDLTKDSCFVNGDPVRLQQVVWNLISNAIKFTPEKGRVAVRLRCDNKLADVTVRDSGRGIEPSFLPYVFERFRQQDASTTRRFGGLGLGLAIARHIVELHGGSIQAESEGEGKGAAFSFFVPRLEMHENTNTVEQRRDNRAEQHLMRRKIEDEVAKPLLNRCILVVDDSADVQLLIRAALKRSGADVVTASSATEGLEIIEHKGVDVLVSDIGMPDIDGLAFIRQIRASANPRVATLPAIALSAYVRDEEKEAARQAGFQYHVGKPVSSTELVTKIVSLLHNKESQSSTQN